MITKRKGVEVKQGPACYPASCTAACYIARSRADGITTPNYLQVIRLSIHRPIHPCMHAPIHASIYPSNHLSVCPCVHASMHSSIRPIIHALIHMCMHAKQALCFLHQLYLLTFTTHTRHIIRFLKKPLNQQSREQAAPSCVIY